ncbi:hypothetical protein HKX48_000346 [Thoreauomyces humboldtii]|nr:hypothetical protein HKX48_000346 [Thoreauomyces humboldtii]
MTELQNPDVFDISSGDPSLSLEATLCRDEARDSMRRTSSAGDIPRTWKGNMTVAAMDLISLRRGSATSQGTANSSAYSVLSADPAELAAQLGPWRGLISGKTSPALEVKPDEVTGPFMSPPMLPNGYWPPGGPPSAPSSNPSVTQLIGESSSSAEQTETTEGSTSEAGGVVDGGAAGDPAPRPAKKPLRSVLRRPSSPTALGHMIDPLPPSPLMRSDPGGLNVERPTLQQRSVSDERERYAAIRRSMFDTTKLSTLGSGENSESSDPDSIHETPGPFRKGRKTSAPDALTHKRNVSEINGKPRPRSAGPRESELELEPRVSFSVDTSAMSPSAHDSSGESQDMSEGHRKAFSAFMGQTRKHSGGQQTPSNQMTAEESRGMRIFLEQCQKRRQPKSTSPNNNNPHSSTASDDESLGKTSGSRDSRDKTRGSGSEARSEVLESYNSLNRKRAKSNNATYTTTKQTHISNMSIFKVNPNSLDQGSDGFAVTIVAEHPAHRRDGSRRIPSTRGDPADDDEDYADPSGTAREGNGTSDSEDIDDLPVNPARKSSGSIKTRKLYLNTDIGEIAGSVAVVSPGNTWRPGRIRSSIASTSHLSSSSGRSSDGASAIRSPWMKAVRLPPRWLSLRNAMAVTNVIIITLAIVIISVVSFLSSRDSASTALDALGTIALKSLALSVGGILGRAEDKNGDTATAVLVSGLLPNTLQCPTYYWSTARRMTRWSGDQFYLVAPNGAFCGLLSPVFPGFEDFTDGGLNTPTIEERDCTLRLANGTAPAPRYAFSLNGTAARACSDITPECVSEVIHSPEYVTDLYDATQRPYFLQAQSNVAASWTTAYNLGSGDGYGFTSVLPVRSGVLSASSDAVQPGSPTNVNNVISKRDLSALIAIAATDIHLDSLSQFIQQQLSALLRGVNTAEGDLFWENGDDSTSSMQFLIADLKTDSILASTCPGLTGNGQQAPGTAAAPDNPPKPFSSLTSDPCFGNLATMVGPLDALPTTVALQDDSLVVLGTPARVWADASLTIAARYSPREGLEWAIVGRVPGQYFHLKLGDMYALAIPLTAALVLVASALCSFLITRAIGRPLKRAAEKMMRIADLNFDEDPNETEADDEDDDDESDYEEAEEKPRRWSISSLRFKWGHQASTGGGGGGSTGPDGEDDGRGRSQETAVRRSFFLPPRSVSRSASDRPKRRRSSAASAVVKKKKKKTAPFVLKEIQLLNTAMDAMTSGLKSFSKYVPLDVVALLVKMKREAVLGVDEMSLSIFFSDIANFTTIAESMSPQQLVLVMSEYLSEMSSIILESQGIVDKFIGDAVMAFWNAPLYLDEHAIVACDAALKSQERLKQMRADWLEKGYPEIRARIGLNTGPALVGNLGSPTRLNYTCLGDTVNLASRLEELNKRYHTSIIVSDAVRDQVHEYFVLRPLDYVAVKGKTVAKKCFELVDSVEECDPAVSRRMLLYEKAFDYYCQGEFEQAKHLFETYLVDVPWDVPATMHLEECMRLEEEGVPMNWSPVVVLDEK